VHKIATKWVTHNLNEVQQWMRCETCYISLEQFCHEGDSMLNWIVATDKIWARSIESELK
jgi:hypothetical protein